MKAFTTTDAALFLNKVQTALEQDEIVNQSVLARCRDLVNLGKPSQNAVMAWTEDTKGVTSAAFFSSPEPMFLFCEPLPKEPSLRLLLNILSDVPFKRVRGKSHVIETFTRLAQSLFRCSVRSIGEANVMRLTSKSNLPCAAGYLRKAAMPDADQMIEWMETARLEAPSIESGVLDHQKVKEEIVRGDYFVWEDGLMVSMAGKCLVTRRGVGLGELFTPPMLRNRGYATSLINMLSQNIFLDGYSFCGVTSDPMNEIANHVFQRLGFTLVSEIAEIEVKS